MKHYTQFDRPKHAGQEPYEGYHEIKCPKTGEKKTVPINPGLCRQEMSADTDINNIMAKYVKTGVLPVMNREPLFGDFSQIETYQESLNLVQYADETFAMLPAQLRARFQNDPGKFIEFCSNPANAKEMVELGLATARPEPKAPDTVPAPKNAPPKGNPVEGDKP